jgi:hypothetical protein
VFSKAEGAHARRKQMWETCAMDLRTALGMFLVGMGVGAISPTALHFRQIRKLKDPLDAARDNSQKNKNECHKPDRRKSA